MRGRLFQMIENMNLEDIIGERIRQAKSLDELALILQMLFEYHSVWPDGQLYSIRALVDYVKGLKIEIHPNEHPPANFHVRGGNVNASFAIEDCRLLDGEISGREHRLLLFWYKNSRHKLIQVWNETRPSDCQVGPLVD